MKCFLLLGNRVGLVIVPRIVLLTKKDEAAVEVGDRFLLIGITIFNIMMMTDMVSPDHRNKGGALWFRTAVCVARAIPWNDGTHAVNKQIVKTKKQTFKQTNKRTND